MATLDDRDSEANRLVETYSPYIRLLSQRLLPQDRGYLEIDELVQRASIRLWLAARTQHIKYPKAYIARIVNSVYVDMQRGFKPVLQLSILTEDELTRGHVLINRSEGMGDPLEELEQQESLNECMMRLAATIAQLPAQQRRAILLRMKERVDDLTLFMKSLRIYEIDIEKERWPSNKIDRQRLASSATFALKKIESRLNEIASHK